MLHSSQFAIPDTPVCCARDTSWTIPDTSVCYTRNSNLLYHTQVELYQTHQFAIPGTPINNTTHQFIIPETYIYQTHQFTIPNTRIPDTPICCTRHQFTTLKKTVCYTRDTSLLYERHHFNYTGDNHVKHLLCCYLTHWLPNIFYTRMQYIENAC